MKAKKIIALGAILATMLTASTFPASAIDMPSSNEDGKVSLMFTQTMFNSVTLDISNGTAYVVSEVQGLPSTTKVTMYAYLQQYNNGSWTTLTSWSNTFNSTYGCISTSCTVPSGFSYRVRTSNYVYNGSTYEYTSSYSGEYSC